MLIEKQKEKNMQILPISNNYNRTKGLYFTSAGSWAERRAAECGRALDQVREAYRAGRASEAEVRSAENARASAVSACKDSSWDSKVRILRQG